MKRAIVIFGFLLTATAFAQEKIPVIQQAMRDEMERSMKELKADGFDKPFFINYAIVDLTTYQMNATLGALVSSQEFTSREALSIRLLVGDYEFNDESLDNNLFSQPQANELSLPIDDDYLGIRRSLWISTDNVYRNASRQFAKNKELLKEQNKPLAEVPHRTFAKVAPSKIDIQAPAVQFNKPAIEDYIRKVSSVFAEYPDVYQSNVDFFYRTGYRYLVNSEGSMNRIPANHAGLSVSVVIRTAEGDISSDNLHYNSLTPEFQPVEKTIAETRQLIEAVIAQSKAEPLTEEYTGPLLYLGDHVAGVLASQLFERPDKLVATDNIPSLKGLRFEPNKSIESKIGKSIFAEGMTVKVMPKLRKYGDKTLIGSYEADIEGVIPADETILVEDGVLKTLLNDRTLTKPGQAANGLGSGPGVFSVTFKRSAPLAEMKQKLIELAKKEGLDYAMMVKGLSDATDNSTSYICKVYVDDGREELVSNADMKEFSLRDFRKIVEVSTEIAAYNESRGPSSVLSVICPQAILFGEAEFTTMDVPNFREEEYVPSPLKK